jgi:hypothetical protein
VLVVLARVRVCFVNSSYNTYKTSLSRHTTVYDRHRCILMRCITLFIGALLSLVTSALPYQSISASVLNQIKAPLTRSIAHHSFVWLVAFFVYFTEILDDNDNHAAAVADMSMLVCGTRY